MRLSELLAFNQITIQCHDNPDADALGSGFALYTYLKEKGKDVSLIYGGANRIRKSNLVLMIQMLKIPIKYCEKIEEPELLITVDCRYGEGNVTRFPAKNIAVIDHHRITGELPPLSDVKSNLGSCATLIWQLLKDEGYDTNANEDLATALYYGLYTDTNELTTISHPLDRDLRDEADFDIATITRFKNANLSLEELDIVGASLLRSDYNDDYNFVVVRANPCDPNILGIISDLILAVDSVNVCLVFCVVGSSVKFSVRSCVREVKASELAQAISAGIGSGGGHIVKAGGRINMDLLSDAYVECCEKLQITPRMLPVDDGSSEVPSISGVKYFLESRMREYFDSSIVIDADEDIVEESSLQTYTLKPTKLGFVRADELFEAGTKMTIRTISGDMEVYVRCGMVLLVGVKGEIYILDGDEFERDYQILEETFSLDESEYEPTIKNNRDTRNLYLLEEVGACIAKKSIPVKAKCLDRKIKLFTQWNDNEYLVGNVGDYMVVRGKDMHELNIIKKEIFTQFYLEE